MNTTSQSYAELAEHSYDRKGEMRDLVSKEVVLEGVTYKVVEYVDTPSGYQGTIYQRADSGDIIVAHRGTEFDRERWNDLFVTDGMMVAGRTNPQAEDAIALTRRALELAQEIGKERGYAPEVTVTGHSLGGTLAQISAHYYDLRGETFNAYGAASLNYRIPEGKGQVINHVTAADMVSAASAHYGQVRIYAMPQEIDMLRDRGYANNDWRLFDPRNQMGAAIDGLGSHDMHYFRNRDGEGRPDRSILSDPRARELAQEYAPMIAKYRQDVEDMRGGLTRGMRGPYGMLYDGIVRWPKPLEPGAPAAREEWQRAWRESPGTPPQSRRSAPPDSELFDATALARRFYGEPAVQPPLRRPESHQASRAQLGPVTLAEARPDALSALLDAARSGSPAALRTATLELQQSDYGRAWQQQVVAHRQELDRIERIPDMQSEQMRAQTADMAR